MHPVVEAIDEQRVVVIIRSKQSRDAVEAAKAMFEAGYRAVEISMTTPNGLEAIAEVADAVPDGGFLGAGTVLHPTMAADATAAGASFVVAPNFRPDVVDFSRRRGVAVIPGAATPTEMVAARDAGADLVKVFPSSLWSPALLTDVLTALPDLQLVPTGGVTLQDAADWLRAGAFAVGLGGALTAGHARRPEAARDFLAGLNDGRLAGRPSTPAHSASS